MGKLFLVVAGLSGCAGVILGALAAHGLKDRLLADALMQIDTASRYLLIHALLLVLTAVLARSHADAMVIKVAGVAVITGIILFCGGLSLSALTGLKVLTAGAPVGGTAFMVGWLSLAYFGLTKL